MSIRLQTGSWRNDVRMKRKIAAILLAGCLGMTALTPAAASPSASKETDKESETKADAEAASERSSETVSETASEASSTHRTSAETGTEDAGSITEAMSETESTAVTERPDYRALDYVTVGQYRQLPVETDEITVTDEDIDAALRAAIPAEDYTDVPDGTVERGDIVNIDYTGKIDGNEFEGGTAKGQDLTIGSGTFIDGFEEGLLGLKAGDTTDLDLTFPEDYVSSTLAGKAVVFTVKINSIRRAPEITSELISEISDGSYSTVEGYRDYQREQVQAQKEEEQENEINTELMTLLYNTCKISSYPPELMAYSKYQITQYYENMAARYGMSTDDFLQQTMGMDEASFEAAVEKNAEEGLQQELILKAIAETEGMEVSDEEYEEGCRQYAQTMGYGDDVENFRNDFGEKEIRVSLLMSRVMQFVRDNAVITVRETETESELRPEEITESATESQTGPAAEKKTKEQSDAATEAAAETTTETTTETKD